MKWTGMAALVLVLAACGLATAVEPTPATIRMPNARGSLFTNANWWTRYGEPVNQEAIDAAPVEAVATPVGWHENGHGYIYGLGACDYTLPCTDWLWEDYEYNPWRCNPHGWHGRCGHGLFGRCGHCGHCGKGHCGCSKALSDCGCATPAHGCVDKVPACDVAPSCDVQADCGCGTAHKCCVLNHFHWHWKKKCFWHKHCGCDTCDMGCGCAAPVDKMMIGPEQAPPKPIVDDTQKAALVWPFGPVR